ncbi:hypothetical protein HK096_002275 [Nowakowskiella sp. JEL0078]|nr:hypothetical protein HK096_002275 [Nowakowskiella sp. JEL0078]
MQSPPLANGFQKMNEKQFEHNTDDEDESSAPGNKRKRTTRACDTCHNKAIKCGGESPSCSHCLKQGLTCTYSRSAKKRGPRVGYIEILENRVKELEASNQIMMKQLTAKSTMCERSSTSPNSLKNRSPQSPQFRPLTLLKLPPDIFNELIDLYFKHINSMFPILNHNVFMKTADTQSPLLLNAMFALSARYSTNISICPNPDQLYSAGDQFYVKARENILECMERPSPSMVSALLMLAMYGVVWYIIISSGSGRDSPAWMFSGMAVRMAQELRLNIEPKLEEAVNTRGGSRSTNTGQLSRESDRRIWWCCYVLDRYCASISSRPTIIADKDCKAYLPCDELEFANMTDEMNVRRSESHTPESVERESELRYQISVLSSTEDFTVGIKNQSASGCFVLLAKIFGKIIEFRLNNKLIEKRKADAAKGGLNILGSLLGAFSTNSNFPTGPDLDHQINVLEASLRAWFTSLPDHIRNIGENFSWDLGSQNPPHYIAAYLHMFYHLCIILLHRPRMDELLRSDIEKVSSSISFKNCHSAAKEMTMVIRKVQKSNPHWHCFSHFVAFAILQGGLLHISAAQIAIRTGNRDGTVEDSKDSVQLHIVALGNITKYWPMADDLQKKLQSLLRSLAVSSNLPEYNSGVLSQHNLNPQYNVRQNQPYTRNPKLSTSGPFVFGENPQNHGFSTSQGYSGNETSTQVPSLTYPEFSSAPLTTSPSAYSTANASFSQSLNGTNQGFSVPFSQGQGISQNIRLPSISNLPQIPVSN